MSENLNETLVEESNSASWSFETYRLNILTLQSCINRGRNHLKCGRIWCGGLVKRDKSMTDRLFGDRRGPAECSWCRCFTKIEK